MSPPRKKALPAGDEGYRTDTADETLKRIEPLIKKAGITRVADITGLDRIGIPVFSCIRPQAKGGAITIHNGKGLTQAQARISAIMEGIERYSAEPRNERLVRMRAADMLASEPALDPTDLVLPLYTKMRLRDEPIAWVKGHDLVSGQDLLVPASAVYHPYESNIDLQLFRTNTNGLASGNSLDEAVLHGICEVAERDAWSMCEVLRKVRSDIDAGDSPIVSEILSRFTTKGVEVHLKDMTGEMGMPVIAAAADDVAMQDAGLLTLGIGAHPSPEVAAVKALTEVAQSRLTQIHGAREDTVTADANRRLGYERVKRMNWLWFGPAESTEKLGTLPSTDKGSIESNISDLVTRIKGIGLSRVIVVDLTRDELRVPVVRIIIPGMEVFAIDSDRVGKRLIEAERKVRR